ncbi:hypothetical protein PIIN_06058 [Serendipita indica DSM 11827]|uniref:Fungal-type protein kinase domain-containing protein n=1 Tax=Serendipita indica (strain DSM 11827) TaxID=1109443 RepID=G4TLC9_SERID|nr:hypothetical protein PIIN_06058 [Serendipita indica DSM 11827]
MLQDFPTSTPVLDGDTTTQMRKEIESSKGPGLLTSQEASFRLTSFKEEGKPLSRAEDSLEFMKALYDAVKAHECLYEVGRILQRDVSTGNVMTRLSTSSESHGIIIGWDWQEIWIRRCGDIGLLWDDALHVHCSGT